MSSEITYLDNIEFIDNKDHHQLARQYQINAFTEALKQNLAQYKYNKEGYKFTLDRCRSSSHIVFKMTREDETSAYLCKLKTIAEISESTQDKVNFKFILYGIPRKFSLSRKIIVFNLLTFLSEELFNGKVCPMNINLYTNNDDDSDNNYIDASVINQIKDEKLCDVIPMLMNEETKEFTFRIHLTIKDS